jgi:hypothetical protein
MVVLPKLVNPQWDSLPAGSFQQVFALRKTGSLSVCACKNRIRADEILILRGVCDERMTTKTNACSPCSLNMRQIRTIPVFGARVGTGN